MDAPTAPGTGVSARFVAHPHSVPTAREVVSDALLSWGLDVLVHDARLVLTELCTNATLHSGASFFHVWARPTSPQDVYLAVDDDGPVPAAAVARRPGRLLAESAQGFELTTGRGLAIVEELAADWGVAADDAGKRVWAELRTHRVSAAPTAQSTPAPARRTPDAEEQGQPLPPGWHVVRLEQCPVALGLAQDDHLDELVRELQLIEPRRDQPRLAALIRGLLDGQASARHMGRRTSQEAAAAGLQHVTVEMLLPDRAADEIERLHEAVCMADALCDANELLTLASPPEVRRLREWMRDEIRDQIRGVRAPQSYESWLADAARS